MKTVRANSGRVQQCGCIALPEEIQKHSGLYPGATYSLELTENGAALLLRTLERSQPSDPAPGVTCT